MMVLLVLFVFQFSVSCACLAVSTDKQIAIARKVNFTAFRVGLESATLLCLPGLGIGLERDPFYGREKFPLLRL
jgi:hypothetical protein